MALAELLQTVLREMLGLHAGDGFVHDIDCGAELMQTVLQEQMLGVHAGEGPALDADCGVELMQTVLALAIDRSDRGTHLYSTGRNR